MADVPEPAEAAGSTLLALGAAGVNPLDLLIARGGFHAGSPPVPYVVGSEGVGRVQRSQRFDTGARVYTMRARTGTFAERFAVDEASAWELPEGDDDELAVALGLAGLAGWLAVAYRARVRAGERVLVLGATGSVGSVAVQAARLLGAGRVVAAGRDPDRLAAAQDLGADVTVDLRRVEVIDALREAFDGSGPDVVVDPLWGPPASAALAVAVPGARIVNLGQAAAPDLPLASATLRGKVLQLLGHSNFETPLDVCAATHRELLGRARRGELRVAHRTYALDAAPEAWSTQAAGGREKGVLIP